MKSGGSLWGESSSEGGVDGRSNPGFEATLAKPVVRMSVHEVSRLHTLALRALLRDGRGRVMAVKGAVGIVILVIPHLDLFSWYLEPFAVFQGER